MTVFLLDTNVISDIVAPTPNLRVVTSIGAHRQDTICLCEAVDYEVRRGYLKSNATTKLTVYEQRIKPQFEWVKISEADWRLAARLWADAARVGKALSDVDLLVAAVALRLSGAVVSADDDFDQLPLRRENWRNP